MGNRLRRLALPMAVVVLAAGCTDSAARDANRSTAPTTVRRSTEGSAEASRSAGPAEGDRASCDPISLSRCALPFPNDYFTRVDAETDTGLRVALRTEDMPQNAGGTRIDVTEQDRNDGFSPGAAMLLELPAIDLAASGAAPITDLAASLYPDAPIVIVDVTSGERHPYWAEIDANSDPGQDPLVLIHPARNWIEGHRYAVGLRDLVDLGGDPIEPTPGFLALRDGEAAADETDIAERRPGMEQIIGDLGRAGVQRSELIAAWDFTVASARSLSERILHMRDDAFATLGDAAPSFQVTNVEEADSGTLLRTVTGTFEVPRYLTGNGEPGSVMNNGTGTDDPLPTANGSQTANFVCTVPRSALDAKGDATPSRMALFGHGLLGVADQVRGVAPTYAVITNTTLCGTDWIGLSQGDVANAVNALGDLSTFRSLPDRMQQGMLNFLFLGRLMKSDRGLTTDPAFQDGTGTALLDHQNLTMVGLSQGGIMGGATTAIAQDWDRAFLGVPGANYGLLLSRSVDFDDYGAFLIPAYPDAADRQLALQLIQMLWDRGENNGYAQHFTSDPYPGTKPKQMMLLEAFGDHQVANISTEVLARTMGVRLRAPALAVGRDPARSPLWDLEPVTEFPAADGSFLVIWDFGTPAPPAQNLPNRLGDDPHGAGATEPRVLEMGATFLDEGRLIDVCDRKPCTTASG